MARGKYAARKRNRELGVLAAQGAQLQADLEAEQQRRARAEAEAAQVRVLRAELAALAAERDRAASAEVARLREEVEALAPVVASAKATYETARALWQDVFGGYVARLGGGQEGLEQAWDMCGGRSGWLNAGVHAKNLDTETVLYLQKVRGVRREIPEASSDERLTTKGAYLHSVLRPVLGATAEVAKTDARPDLAELADRPGAVWRSTPFTVTLDALRAWGPHPLLGWPRDGALGELPLALGAVSCDEDAGGRPLAHARLYDRAHWADVALRDAAITRGTGRMPWPFSLRPRFPRPGDAVLLRHHYATAATGMWSRVAETTCPERVGAGEESAWADAPPRPLTLSWAEVALGLRHAMPFWLPPGQTAGFAGSEPLTAADLADVRLPFEGVLLVFAEPLELAAIRLPSQAEQAQVRLLEAALRTARCVVDERTVTSLVNCAEDEYLAAPLPLDVALCVYGAQVEAVLLRADVEGRVHDLFAWCLALRSPSSGWPLGRIVVPALRSRTAWAAEVNNLAAVAAWGDWHGPDAELKIPQGATAREYAQATADAQFRALEPRGGAGGVRVLDVARTGGQARSVSAPTGRSVAPHVRRGHWRRQHFGPRGENQVKRVRIAPTLVNAGRSSELLPQVYRLPRGRMAGDSAGRERP